MAEISTVIAHHAYEPTRDDELMLREGDIVHVTDSSDPDWWVGKKDDGSSGYFPSNFVDPKTDDVAKEPASKADDSAKDEENDKEEHKGETQVMTSPPPVKAIGMARVMEDYAMQEAGEMTLHRGDIVTLYERLDDGWLKGEINGRSGRFPGEYVEEIDMPGRPDLGAAAPPISSKTEPAEEGSEQPSKPAFKLAAYGVKQGGIGSLLAGGIPTLKKTGAASSFAKKPPVPEPIHTEPSAVLPAPVKKPSVPEPVQAEPKFVAKAIVLHPYDAENEDELSLLRGEYVSIIDKDADDGWWKGITERGATGVFPSNFVKEIEEETMASPPPIRSRKSVTSAGSQHSFASASSSIATNIRAPPITSKTSRPPSITSPGRPESVHEQTPVTESPPPIPEEQDPPKPISPQPTSTRDEPEAEKESNDAAGAESESSISGVPENITSPEEEEEKKEERPPSDGTASNNPPSIPARPTSATSIEAPAPVRRSSSDVRPTVPGRPGSSVSIKSPSSAQSPSDEIPPAIPGRPSGASPAIAERRSTNDSVSSISESLARSPPKEDSTPFVDSRSLAIGSPTEETESAMGSHEESPASPAPTPIGPGVPQQEKAEESEKEGATSLSSELDKELEEVAAEQEEEKREADREEPKVEEKEQEKEKEQKAFDMQPTGPKLTAPTRARPGGARRARETRTEEPSQTEILQRQLAEEPAEEPRKSPEVPSPPAKPVKPIFAKFPTPFGGAAPPDLKSLKPVQRRMWEPAPAHEPEANNKGSEEKKEDEPARPMGVRNIASRFNVPTGGGSNEVLETKLKNFTKNEIEKTRKEFERQLEEEREKRMQLEQKVEMLLEQLQALQAQTQAE
ncbi:hypothetical protein BX666DRAFT_1937494 [Dichotomocladium elegans]|nr:hypothetical protein BX666DRAFT_1937494 [Dichotomocladium elegans]